MNFSFVLMQFMNGLAGASSLFLLAAGLSLIFGVTRIVNFAHGSLYLLGMYLAVWLSERVGFWVALPGGAAIGAAAACAVGFFRRPRTYRAPDLLQFLGTFAPYVFILC